MCRTSLSIFFVLCGVMLTGANFAHAATPPQFEKDILPLFYHRCFSCHSEKQAKPKGKLRLDTAQAIRESGVVKPGQPEQSELLTRVLLPHTDEDLMPPLEGGGQPLNEAERLLLRQWIADGAKMGSWVKFDHREAALLADKVVYSRAQVRPLAAELQKRVQRQQVAAGTKPNPPINDETFLRRVYLDVTGRIPSAAESQRFLDDKTADKRAKLIDVLLNGEGYISHTFNWKADQLRLITHGIAGQPGWLYEEWVKETIRSGLGYDEFVRQLLTASGYIWQNGAVGFYLRDLGMPLDHMSNMTRVFLGTRIECAQCHDHPLEPITQKDFYQMVAYTSHVSNLYSSAGFSVDNVKQWPELKARLATLKTDKALAQGLSRTIAPLKRMTTDTKHELTFPKTYEYDAAVRGKPVEPRTLFGDEAPAALPDRRKAFAAWMTSPRNPRFAKNIANRLWKRVMGMGLIEPVDSFSAMTRPAHAELMDFLTQTMIRLRFDERAFLAMLLNTPFYQSEAVREEPGPDAAFELRGPLLRRLSAEQIWDSLLVLLVEDLDARKNLIKHDRSEMDPDYLRKLTSMTADEIIERAKVEMDYRIRYRAQTQRVAAQSEARKAAAAKGGTAEVRRVQSEQAAENARFDADRNAIQMGGAYYAVETDPRWSKLPRDFIRASETKTPIALGHFLRQFGQSDRREIDASNKEPNTTHSLALMNGEVTRLVLENDSLLRRQLRANSAKAEPVRAIYQAILVRNPDATELQSGTELFKTSPTPETDLIWALLNSPEFLFIQ